MTPTLRNFLNLSRWCAALLVVIHHVRHLIVVDYQYAEHVTLLDKGLYFITGFGHESVVIFFVISGFLVGGISLDRWRAQGPDLAAYFAARISRIYTVLIPALLIGLGLDLVGLTWFNASELYTNSIQYNTISLNHAIDATMNLPTLLGNFFMLQGIVTPTLGSNGPLWSLSYEWWYYCIFACLAAAATGNGRARVLVAVLGCAMLLLLPTRIPLWGSIWVLGMMCYRWVKSTAWRPAPILGLGLFVLAMLASRLSHDMDNAVSREALFVAFGRDLGLGLAFALALVSSARLAARWGRFLPALNERLADFSYSTYLLHFPAMMIVVAVLAQVSRISFQLEPGASSWVYTFGLSALLYGFCFAVFWCTERHTPAVKRWLDARFASWGWGAATALARGK